MKKQRFLWYVCCPFLVLSFLGAPVSHGIAQQQRKSPGKAFFYSLLVPGLGQRYVEDVAGARAFIAGEVLLVGLAVGHDVYAGSLEKDYRAFAASHAGVNSAGKSDNFFVEIAKARDIYAYNEKRRINRDFDRIIPETPGNIWVWDSDESRNVFRQRRVDADTIRNRTVFFYTGLFLNHIANGIHAAIKARRYNSRNGTRPAPDWEVGVVSGTDPAFPVHTLRVSLRF